LILRFTASVWELNNMDKIESWVASYPKPRTVYWFCALLAGSGALLVLFSAHGLALI